MTTPNNTILILVGMLLIFLSIIFIATPIKKSRSTQPTKSEPQPTQPKPIKKERHEEVVDTLNWMLQYNIITSTEYNQLLIKSLPYLN